MRLFIFAIGGTGSRVLKSLAMLCAAGVKPIGPDGLEMRDFEIVPIIIDPHKANEDLKRTERILNDYRMLRRTLYGEAVNATGFFAAKISSLAEIVSDKDLTLTNSFNLNMAAVEQQKFRDYIGLATMNEANQALTSLLFAPYQLDNKMNIGFVGSPNIGSVALNQIKDSDEFRAFANVFQEGDRIFFVSSIFGGTGAAGFPILTKNIRQAENLDVSNKDLLRRAPIGALTVLPYFNLRHNDDGRIDKADFVVKTQSALHYYNQTITHSHAAVNSIYYLGDQVMSKPYPYDPGEHGQMNRAHLIEFVGAMAPLHFAASRVTEGAPTVAYEYGLERDTAVVDFLAFGSATRRLIYRPLVKMHLLLMFVRTGLESTIGKGFTEDKPKIRKEFLNTEFFRTFNQQFLTAYSDWLAEMSDNNRSVQIFNGDNKQMGSVIHGVGTRKGLLGHKSIGNDSFVAAMNKLSRTANTFGDNEQELKFFSLFNQAAEKLIDEKYEKI